MKLDMFEFLKDSKSYITLKLDKNMQILSCNENFIKTLAYDKDKNSINEYLVSKDSNEICFNENEVILYAKNNQYIYFKCRFFKEEDIVLAGELYYKEDIDIIEQMSKINGKLASTTRELHKKNSLLQQAYGELIEKEHIVLSQSRSTAMNEVLFMLAHQWRQPLNNISINVILIEELLKQCKCELPEIKTLINKIHDINQNLSDTINVFTSKLAQDQKQITTIDSVINDVYEIVVNTFKNENIEIECIYNDGDDIAIIPSIFMQLLLIVIQNSLDAFALSDEKHKKFLIETKEDKAHVYITLSDNAGGIDNEILQKVFEPYFSTKHEKNDVGLGLYIAKLLCKKVLNGSIDVENQNGGVLTTIKVLKVHE